MNDNIIIYLFLILLFGYFSIKEDILKRKVSNKITYSLFLISIITFIININKLKLENIIAFFIIFIIAYYLYRFNFWAAADGKLYIGISIILISIQEYYSLFNYLLNIVFLYSLTIIILVIFKTSSKSKLKVLKKLNYGLKIFQLTIIFSIMSLFYNFIFDGNLNKNNLILLIIYMLTLFLIIAPSSKKIFKKLDSELQLFINLILSLILFLFSKEIFIYYFIIVLSFKIFLDFTSKSTEEIKINNNIYSSPFSIFLFSGAIITLITNSNIILILIKFFS